MAHARQQLRAAVVTKLTGLTTTVANVFTSRTLPLGAVTPALCIYTSSEVFDYDQGSLGNRPMRFITLNVNGYHSGDDDDTLDTIAAEVETALFADPTLGGLAQYLVQVSQEISRDGDGETQTGVIDIEMQIAYRAVDGAPTVPL